MAGGPKPPDHQSHRNGLQVDIRPLRKDGVEAAVTWMDSQYDEAATAKLIALFRVFAPVVCVYFNGPDIPFDKPLPHHDNHFHVQLRG